MSESALKDQVPDFRELMNPCLEAFAAHTGDPMTVAALTDAVATRLRLPAEVRRVAHGPSHNMSELAYRLTWTRSYLKKLGYLENPVRGRWQISASGRAAIPVNPEDVVRAVRDMKPDASAPPALSDEIAEELSAMYPLKVEERGHLFGDALQACYARFRERFGPEQLARRSGRDLLEFMHGRGTRDSLVYWLEFKNDEELPAVFGSISGGSALKFGIYQSTDTGHWMTGAPSAQQRLELEAAIETAERQRDELVAGAALLASLTPESVDYEALEVRMGEVAPTLADSSWGHKYFALLHPELLDDYHNLNYQRYHLHRIHQLPTDGRYSNARLLQAFARQLDMPVSHFATLLNARNGEPGRVWRVGTSAGDDLPSEWGRMYAGGFAAVGWSDVGDLSDIERSRDGLARVRELIEAHHPNHKATVTRGARQLYDFVRRASVGDVIVAMKGQTVLGIGEVRGDYYHQPEDGPFAHRRPVSWHATQVWKLPLREGLLTTFVPLGKKSENLVEIYRHLDLGLAEGKSPPQSARPSEKSTLARRPPLAPLTGRLEQIRKALDRKGQVILHGPPGTGKTWIANQAIQELAARSWYGKAWKDLSTQEADALENEQGAIARCTFHPAYGYEDFILGYRPEVRDGELTYALRDGIFLRLCERARANPKRRHFLLIDEINRGDIPRIFGELLTLLEKDKRGLRVTLPLGERSLAVPKNLAVIGTMNTADRSIALLDAALRRRFSFIEMMPDPDQLAGVKVRELPLNAWLRELNQRVLRYAGRDSRGLQIGHSYLMQAGETIRSAEDFIEALREDIIPLLQEYCYDDYETLAHILGPGLVRVADKSLNEALFQPGRRDELFEALRQEFKDILATWDAVAADEADDTDDADDLAVDEADEADESEDLAADEAEDAAEPPRGDDAHD